MRSTFDLFRGGDSAPDLVPDPGVSSERILRMNESEATSMFQRLPATQQLGMIESTADPFDREELYYLVPDATELIQASRVEGLMEIINTRFGTGLACGILSAVSPTQFSEMFERTVVKDGAIDRETVMLWVAELTELETNELSDLLSELDVELLAELLKDRIELPSAFQGLTLDAGLVELENIEFGEDEQARMIAELIWASDPDLFLVVLRTLLTENESTSRVEEGLTEEEAIASGPDAADAAREEDISTFDLKRIDDLLPPPKSAR